MRTRIAARPRFMVSCRDSASSLPNAAWPAIYGAYDGGVTRGTLAGVSAESPRSDCRLRLPHGSDGKFRLLYCFFVIEHARRKILHFNVKSADWVVRQLRAAAFCLR